jgi:hypothetical protein
MKRESKSEHKAVSVAEYDAAQAPAAADTCRELRAEIERALPEATGKVWHGSPVWFVGETPVVGYKTSANGGGVVLLFWNGQALDSSGLEPVGKFKAAQTRYEDASSIEVPALRRWLKLAGTTLWDVDEVRKLRARAQPRR